MCLQIVPIKLKNVNYIKSPFNSILFQLSPSKTLRVNQSWKKSAVALTCLLQSIWPSRAASATLRSQAIGKCEINKLIKFLTKLNSLHLGTFMRAPRQSLEYFCVVLSRVNVLLAGRASINEFEPLWFDNCMAVEFSVFF